MTDNTIEINADGETVEVQVEELNSLEIMRWAAKAPDSLKSGDPTEVIDFMVDLTTEQTVLTEELLQELDQKELGRVIGGVVAYAFGQEPESERDDDADVIDFDGDGVDLGDWE